MIFWRNWCSVNYLPDITEITCHTNLDTILKIDQLSINEILKKTTNAVNEYLGDNIALCLSGGIDSQAALLLLSQNIKVTPIIFKFKFDLNSEEIADALRFCRFHNLNPEIIEIDVLRFLNFDLISFASEYKMSSPQFCVHAQFLKIVQQKGYTGAVLGGNGFVVDRKKVYPHLTTAQLSDIEKWSELNFPVVTNFLSFTEELSLKLAMSTPMIDEDITYESNYTHEQKAVTQKLRYHCKINSYRALGVEVIPQKNKMTGFEELKKYLAKLYNDNWQFESMYRFPLYLINKNNQTLFKMDSLVNDYILSKSNNLVLSLPGEETI